MRIKKQGTMGPKNGFLGVSTGASVEKPQDLPCVILNEVKNLVHSIRCEPYGAHQRRGTENDILDRLRSSYTSEGYWSVKLQLDGLSELPPRLC